MASQSDVLKLGLRQPKLRDRAQLIVKLAEITHRRGQTDDAIKILRDGIADEADPRHMGKVYHYCSELLEVSGDVVGAEDVLRNGLEAPAITNQIILVQALAMNLAKQNRPQEAVDLLCHAVEWPGISGIVSLYQTWARILVKDGQVTAAIDVLRNAMTNKTIGNLGALYTQCAKLLNSVGSRREAVELLHRGIEEFPKDLSLTDLLKTIDP